MLLRTKQAVKSENDIGVTSSYSCVILVRPVVKYGCDVEFTEIGKNKLQNYRERSPDYYTGYGTTPYQLMTKFLQI